MNHPFEFVPGPLFAPHAVGEGRTNLELDGLLRMAFIFYTQFVLEQIQLFFFFPPTRGVVSLAHGDRAYSVPVRSFLRRRYGGRCIQAPLFKFSLRKLWSLAFPF